MIIDEKRREVAEKLRELATPGCIRYAEEFYEELREIVAFDLDGSFDGVANSLADLIDRPTCEFKQAYGPDLMVKVSLVECTACAWTIEPWNAYYFRYCPMCGAEVIDEDGAN